MHTLDVCLLRENGGIDGIMHPRLLLERTLWYSKALQAAFETMPRMSRILKAEANAGDCWLSVSSTAHAEFCHLRLSATSKVHSE